MRELITVHLGQAGVQTGSACWSLFCKEHNILPDGTLQNDKEDLTFTSIANAKHEERRISMLLKSLSLSSGSPISGASTTTSSASSPSSGHSRKLSRPFETLFQESAFGRYVPRALFIDLDPGPIDVLRTTRLMELFNPEFLESGKEDAASNFARGYYLAGHEIINPIIDKFQLAVNQCDNLQGFLIFHATGGGTGSGLGSLLSEALSDLYPRKPKLHFTTWPSPHIATSVVEPYNTILATRGLLEHSDITAILDNEAIYDICCRHLSIQQPHYSNLNSIVSQVISSLTSSLRFNGSLNIDIAEFQTNLVPFPRLHFMLTSHAPLLNCNNVQHEIMSVRSITTSAFNSDSMLAKCDPRDGKYMACCLMYRGDVTPKDMTASISMMRTKSSVKFVNWCPTGFKTGISCQTPTVVPESCMAPVPRSVTMIANSTSIQSLFTRVASKFDAMFSKRAFIHWYIADGMEEGEFLDVREDVLNLEQDYNEINKEQQLSNTCVSEDNITDDGRDTVKLI